MKNDSSVSISPQLELTISGAAGNCTVQLNRIAAQHFAAAIQKFSGVPSKGVTLNAGVFHSVPATSASSLTPNTRSRPVVRLGRPRGGVVRL